MRVPTVPHSTIAKRIASLIGQIEVLQNDGYKVVFIEPSKEFRGLIILQGGKYHDIFDGNKQKIVTIVGDVGTDNNSSYYNLIAFSDLKN